VPPPTYKLDPLQLPPGLQASGNVTESLGEAFGTTEPEASPRQACSTGFRCPATTLPRGCSRTGARWRAPSCKCYDTPLDSVMRNKPVPININSAGEWINRGNGSDRLRIKVRPCSWDCQWLCHSTLPVVDRSASAYA
jgi:hypothetical protein